MRMFEQFSHNFVFDLSEKGKVLQREKWQKKYDTGSKGQFYVAECKTQEDYLAVYAKLKRRRKKILAFHNQSPHAVDLCQ